MKHRNIMGGLLALLFVGVMGTIFLASQDKAAVAKLSGSWKISVPAGEETYILDMMIKAANGKFEGTVSESSGAFTNLPLTKIEFANDTLKIEFKSITPPDGQERMVQGEFKVSVDKMEGTMTIPELSLSIPSTASREKK